MEIVGAVKKLNSISRERLNFLRRPILCSALYRNLMQTSNFGGTFDQLYLRIFYKTFTEDASLPLLYHGAKKSKMTKNSNQGGGSSPSTLPLSGTLFPISVRSSCSPVPFQRGCLSYQGDPVGLPY